MTTIVYSAFVTMRIHLHTNAIYSSHTIPYREILGYHIKERQAGTEENFNCMKNPYEESVYMQNERVPILRVKWI